MIWDKEKIKNLRVKLGLSQAEFAHRLGCRQQTVSEWELGIYLPANAYGRLLATLQNEVAGASTSWLMDLEEAEVEISPREFDPAID